MVEASQNTRALITKVKSPTVSKLIGMVKNTNIGRIKMFIRPITSAAPKADKKPAKLMPGTTQAIKSSAKVESSHLRRMYSIVVSPEFFNQA